MEPDFPKHFHIVAEPAQISWTGTGQISLHDAAQAAALYAQHLGHQNRKAALQSCNKRGWSVRGQWHAAVFRWAVRAGGCALSHKQRRCGTAKRAQAPEACAKMSQNLSSMNENQM